MWDADERILEQPQAIWMSKFEWLMTSSGSYWRALQQAEELAYNDLI